MSKLSLVLSLTIVLCGFYTINALEKDWDYVLEGVHSNSTDETKITADLRPLRVTPTEYGFNGTVTITDVINDDYMLEGKMYRSATGSNQYQLTPFQVLETPMYKFMNTHYKKLLMNSLKDCSNLPVFEEFKGPFTGEYYAKSCVLQNDGWPNHMQPGFYKVIATINGPLAKFVLEVIIKINAKAPGL